MKRYLFETVAIAVAATVITAILGVAAEIVVRDLVIGVMP